MECSIDFLFYFSNDENVDRLYFAEYFPNERTESHEMPLGVPVLGRVFLSNQVKPSVDLFNAHINIHFVWLFHADNGKTHSIK